MRVLRVCLLLALAGPWLTPARAVVGTARVDANTPESPFSGLGSVGIGQGVYSGVLVAPDFVLTAAHVVAGHDPGEVGYQLNLGSRTVLLAARDIRVYPAYRGTRPGADGVWHDDLALIRLAGAAPPEAHIYDLSAGVPLFTEVVLVGYGASGAGGAAELLPGDAGTKRVGRNRIEQILDGGGLDTAGDVFAFRFGIPADPPGDASFQALSTGEAGFAGGDSGAPVFVREGDALKLAGLATFTAQAKTQTDAAVALAGGTLLAPYQAWIEQQIRSERRPAARSPCLLSGLGVTLLLVMLGAVFRLIGSQAS